MENSPEITSSTTAPHFSDTPEVGGKPFEIEYSGFDKEKSPLSEEEIKSSIEELKSNLENAGIQPEMASILIKKIEYNPIQEQVDKKYGLNPDGSLKNAAAFCYYEEGRIVFFDAITLTQDYKYVVDHEFGHLVDTRIVTDQARAEYFATRQTLLSQGKIQDTDYARYVDQSVQNQERFAEDFAHLLKGDIDPELKTALKTAISSRSVEQTKTNVQQMEQIAKTKPGEAKYFGDPPTVGEINRKKKPGEL